jgi:hypothetical protein
VPLLLTKMADSEFEYYCYDPSLAAAVIFIIAFIAIITLHCYQLLRTYTWFMIPFIVGGFCASLNELPVCQELTKHV